MCRKVTRTFITEESKPIVIVCNNGKGIENFKIVESSPNHVTAEFEFKDVRGQEIVITDEERICQNYYIIDVEKKKILRVPLAHDGSKFSKGFRKMAVVFGVWSEVVFILKENKLNYEVRAIQHQNAANVQKEIKDYTEDDAIDAATHRWCDEEKMPGEIWVIDFKSQKVHNLQEVSFLD